MTTVLKWTKITGWQQQNSETNFQSWHYAYAAGALDVKKKELLGLVASAVLRCDDCVKYHLETSQSG
jgi:alkylhydroperoxidase/carboxymuconolactone decarboxylase family protein YurZ